MFVSKIKIASIRAVDCKFIISTLGRMEQRSQALSIVCPRATRGSKVFHDVSEGRIVWIASQSHNTGRFFHVKVLISNPDLS